MSKETMEWLNREILVGNCKERPAAWHDDPELRERLGLPNNHFQDPIPYQVVVDRLFNWHAISTPKANLVPCSKNDANFFGPQGQPYRVTPTGEWKKERDAKGKEVYAYEGEQGIVRSDTFGHIATHGKGYRIHDYKQWLLQLQSNVLGDTLTILGAGLLRGGAQAYVQVALPETAFDEMSGLKFVPYIMAATSLDGSIPTTFSAQSLLVVCDNTRDMALRQSEKSGQIYKAKHTSNSLETERIKDVREALGIIHQTTELMLSEFHELASISITRRQTIKVLDIIQPIPSADDPGVTERKVKIAENKRERLMHTIFRDPIGGREWSGTALGLVNGVNTWFHHYSTIKGNRPERNMERAIKGDFGTQDRDTVKALAAVLDRPDLVSAK